MARKAEFTIKVCIRIPDSHRPGAPDRNARRLEHMVTRELSERGATIVHSSHHVRTWAD